MKRSQAVLAIVITSVLLFLWGGILAAKPAGKDGGNPSGGSGTITPDYGDLIVLYRNDNGVPYVTEEILVFDPDADQFVTGGLCQQPIPTDSCPEECVVDGTPNGETVVAVEPLTCSVPLECSMCTLEVEIERDNVIRAKESVLAQQLVEATVKLATAGCVTLDPAGRPVASNLVDGVVVSSTVDSPLQNLAFYRQLMQNGYVGDNQEDAIDLRTNDYLVSAARALGGSAPKEGKVGIDTVVYINQILGLTQLGASVLPRIYKDVREEVKGVMTVVRKWFLDYSGYEYNRSNNFSTAEESLPSPSYIPDYNPSHGYFEYLAKVGEFYTPTQGSIFEIIFKNNDASGQQLKGFTQAADDTRAVVNFTHLWAVPEEDTTSIDCDATTSDFYDVLISDRSGLQVPVRMVAAGDGREGTLTIENNGPATAYDIEVTLQGVYEDANGAEQSVEILNEMGGYPIFQQEPIILSIDPGYSASISFFFEMDQATTIKWRAEAITDDLDVNLSNNEVVEYTKVNEPEGNGGGDH